jgi:predicted ArsR family transcriptional regulator
MSIFIIFILNIDRNNGYHYNPLNKDLMMTGTREKVLRTLLTHPRSTINDLSDAVGISPISIRHHIASLQAENLVTCEEERHGVGRPRQLFSLTETGVEQFPTRYVRLTIRLLQQLKETMPEALVSNLFTQMAQELARDMATDIDTTNLTFQERLALIVELLRHEGFSIEWERLENSFLIHEVSCPYYYIGQNHPEICTVDQVLISTVLNVPAEKVKCILNGDSVCTYTIPVPTTAEAQ